MACDYIALATPGIQRLQPYQPGKPEEELERELGLSNIVKLASNENPMGPSPSVLEGLPAAIAGLARYPDGSGFRLKKKLAYLSQNVMYSSEPRMIWTFLWCSS